MKGKIIHLNSVDSTNEYAKRNKQDLNSWDIVIADEQTKGKGTHNRTFYSPQNGIYMSIPIFDANENFLPILTCAVAVAVHDAIFEVLKIKTSIKWINDLYTDKGKVCGILCEHTGNLTIIGVGLNLSAPAGGYPDDISNIAGALLVSPSNEEIKRSLVFSIQQNIIALYRENNKQGIMQLYKKYSMLIGKKVEFYTETKNIFGTVLDFNENGNIIIETENRKVTFCSGQVRILK